MAFCTLCFPLIKCIKGCIWNTITELVLRTQNKTPVSAYQTRTFTHVFIVSPFVLMKYTSICTKGMYCIISAALSLSTKQWQKISHWFKSSCFNCLEPFWGLERWNFIYLLIYPTLLQPQSAFCMRQVELLCPDLPLKYPALPIALLSITLGSAATSHSPSLKSYSAMSFLSSQLKAFP